MWKVEVYNCKVLVSVYNYTDAEVDKAKEQALFYAPDPLGVDKRYSSKLIYMADKPEREDLCQPLV